MLIMSYNVYIDTTWSINHLSQIAATFINIYAMHNLKQSHTKAMTTWGIGEHTKGTGGNPQYATNNNYQATIQLCTLVVAYM